MKKISLILIAGTFCALSAQDGQPEASQPMGQEQMTAQPHGGFSKSVGGKWKCGKLGTMTLTDTKGKVKGTYTTNQGTITGTVNGDSFTGDWKEAKGGKKGSFKLKTSIRTMTNKPTNLDGTRTVAAKGAREETVECKK